MNSTFGFLLRSLQFCQLPGVPFAQSEAIGPPHPVFPSSPLTNFPQLADIRIINAAMDMRHFHDSLKRLKAFAKEAELSGEQVSKMIQPFIEEWRTVATPRVVKKADGAAMHLPNAGLSFTPLPFFAPDRANEIAVRIKAIGMNLVKAKLTGIRFHNAFQLHVAHLANQFDVRGWTESAAEFMDPEEPESTATSEGRIDVVWARNRIPVTIFEIDSTIKLKSFAKLREGLSPHKFWIYFGKDVWGFKSFLLKEDPKREIIPVIIPQTFTPSFADPPPAPRAFASTLPRVSNN
jgi:hypothetical protein